MRSQLSQSHYQDVIFGQIGTTDRFFVEFGFNEPDYEHADGSALGSGANTHKLYECGWRGLLLTAEFKVPKINLQNSFLYRTNVGATFEKYAVPYEFDYLSVDMDSWDIFVMQGIFEAGYRPRVISTEYNSNYPPLELAITQLDPSLLADFSLTDSRDVEFLGCIWGASPTAWRVLMERYGYTMVSSHGNLFIIVLPNQTFLVYHAFI